MASSYDAIVEEACDSLVILLLGILQSIFPQIAKYQASQDARSVGGAICDVQVQVHWFLVRAELKATIIANGNVEVEEVDRG